jgi:uncharacterized membrane protein
MGTNRLESFSDGVIAVAITLLVLNISVPEPGPGRSLGHELAHMWPQYAAYVVSFLTIGIIWINHHAMINRLASSDHAILILNLPGSSGESVAALVYGGSLLVMAALFAALNRHILLVKAHRLAEPLPEAQRRRILSRSARGLIPYVVATALAVVSPYLTLAICASLAVYYALPVASGLQR